MISPSRHGQSCCRYDDPCRDGLQAPVIGIHGSQPIEKHLCGTLSFAGLLTLLTRHNAPRTSEFTVYYYTTKSLESQEALSRGIPALFIV
jgi:hypothetical protein